MIASVKNFHEDSDRDLERRVAAFLAERSVPALRRLNVASHQGVVTLRGEVPSFYDKQIGLHVARRVAGVVHLVDDVRVTAAETFADPRPPRRSARGANSASADVPAEPRDQRPAFRSRAGANNHPGWGGPAA